MGKDHCYIHTSCIIIIIVVTVTIGPVIHSLVLRTCIAYIYTVAGVIYCGWCHILWLVSLHMPCSTCVCVCTNVLVSGALSGNLNVYIYMFTVQHVE